MAEEKISYHCGCGFKTTMNEHAHKHTNKLQHEIEIRGKLLPDGVKKGVVRYSAKEDIFDGLVQS